MANLTAGFILFLTVFSGMALGIAGAYGLITAILLGLARRPEPKPAAPVLARQTAAGGD